VALLATMMLRGPQTIGELRINSDRLHRFADGSAVEGFLNELAERSAGALAVMLPRLPGARENRWMHLLSGTPADVPADIDSAAAPPRDDTLRTEISALKRSVSELRDEIESLKAAISHLNRDA
jgi:uncharacterized protein YceH (UPF0502 family)